MVIRVGLQKSESGPCMAGKQTSMQAALKAGRPTSLELNAPTYLEAYGSKGEFGFMVSTFFFRLAVLREVWLCPWLYGLRVFRLAVLQKVS